MIPLSRLTPGTRFLQPDLQIEGLLVKVNSCRAVVRIERPMKEVKFTDPDGNVRHFQAKQCTDQSWGPTVSVIPLSVDPNFEGETNMTKKAATKKESPKAKATKKAAKPAAEKKTRQPKAAKPETAKPDGEAKPKKLSQLDAAAQVLKAAGRPMTCNEMVQAMAEAGLWSSPGGKTPAATLYAAIIREIANKPIESRFVKTERGTFSLA